MFIIKPKSAAIHAESLRRKKPATMHVRIATQLACTIVIVGERFLVHHLEIDYSN
jgi:hypothetical protein